jgi:hypothetical protein
VVGKDKLSSGVVDVGLTEEMVAEDYGLKALIAGMACAIAGAILNPLDVIKIR